MTQGEYLRVMGPAFLNIILLSNLRQAITLISLDMGVGEYCHQYLPAHAAEA